MQSVVQKRRQSSRVKTAFSLDLATQSDEPHELWRCRFCVWVGRTHTDSLFMKCTLWFIKQVWLLTAAVCCTYFNAVVLLYLESETTRIRIGEQNLAIAVMCRRRDII